jgi:ABC-type multidrug transport system fused ATPase/permease subunit
MYRVDEGLPRQFNMLFVTITRILFILAIISVGTPIFAVLIVPLALIYIFMQRYYLRTKRELKRLDSTSRSPVFAHFQESLGGITTIRAYVQQKRFSMENEERLDANMRAYFPSISANRWLGVRLEFIGSIIIFSAAGFAISSVSMGSGLPAGTVGLVISYALSVPPITFSYLCITCKMLIVAQPNYTVV